MTRKRGFQLAAQGVLAATVLLVSVLLDGPGPPVHSCPRPPGEVCDPPGDEISTPRMWVGIGGVVLAFLLFLSGALEGTSHDGET